MPASEARVRPNSRNDINTECLIIHTRFSNEPPNVCVSAVARGARGLAVRLPLPSRGSAAVVARVVGVAASLDLRYVSGTRLRARLHARSGYVSRRGRHVGAAADTALCADDCRHHRVIRRGLLLRRGDAIRPIFRAPVCLTGRAIACPYVSPRAADRDWLELLSHRAD